MKKIILILFILLSACTRIQSPDPLKIDHVSSFIYIKEDTHYFFQEEDLVFLLTYFNQSEPTTYKKIVESTERFEIKSDQETIYLTLFQEKEDYFIQNGDNTYLLSNTFYPKLLEYMNDAETYKLNIEEKEVIQINDQYYVNTYNHPEHLPTCGTYDGFITSVVDSKYLPNKENEANFNCLNVPYIHHIDDSYILLIDNEWLIFKSLS